MLLPYDKQHMFGCLTVLRAVFLAQLLKEMGYLQLQHVVILEMGYLRDARLLPVSDSFVHQIWHLNLVKRFSVVHVTYIQPLQ